MTFAQDIDEIVRGSKAYDNPFFANCKDTDSESVSIDDVTTMAVNWYLVTKHFGLSTPSYTGHLARILKYASTEEAELLQQLLSEAASISSDDLGLGHVELYAQYGGEDIPLWKRLHYKLWGDMTEKLLRATRSHPHSLDGLNITNAESTGLIQKPTVDLVGRIEGYFDNVESGVAVYQTVESIAYNIVLAYSDLIKQFTQGTNPVLTPRDLIYLEIHKPLEKDHDLQSTRMVDLLRKYAKMKDGYNEEEFRGNMILKVCGLCKSFGNFWDAMNLLVFKELPIEP